MLKIFNSATRKKEKFKSIKKNFVKLYVCGVTVYELCHIGHARTFISFDMIIRYLKHCGYNVYYVRNITDIDDKIISSAKRNKESINQLSNRMIQQMHYDFSLLNIIPPNEEPKVTDNIDVIIKMINLLILLKCAYIAQNGDVMFSIKKFSSYGKLSNQILDKQLFNVNYINMIKNRCPLDFVLWKISKNEEPYWISPWGKGRPGWHIECSAISDLYLGPHYDIHGGGIDLIFPHHENENAQSVSVNNKFRVNYWIHCGMLINHNEKMSKSLNNVLNLRDILHYYHPEVIRYYILSTHYRHPLNYEEGKLKESYNSLQKLYRTLFIVDIDNYFLKNEILKKNVCNDQFDLGFYEAMNDDFNTPKAFSILFKLSNKINSLKLTNKIEAIRLAFKLKKLGNILGLLYCKPQVFLGNISKCFTKEKVDRINVLLAERDEARRLKLWDKADAIRKKLYSWDIIVEDYLSHTFWRKKTNN